MKIKKIAVLCVAILFQWQCLFSKETRKNPTDQVVELNARGGLPNFFAKIARGDSLKVAYLGGSITAQDGWRVLSLRWLNERFPLARFSEINAAIGGTGSDFGVFRMNDHVLKFKPDLVFVEFAVNDSNTPPEKITRSMEGIVRQIWQHDPHTDICFVYTIEEQSVEALLKGQSRQSVETMEAVAGKYQVPCINFGCEVVRMVKDKQLIMKGPAKELNGVKVFSSDGVHPFTETGHTIYNNVLRRSFESMAASKKTGFKKHTLPKPIASDYFANTQMIDFTEARLSENWQVLQVADQPAFGFAGKYLTKFGKASKSGETLIIRFKGRTIGAYDIMGPDAGKVIVEIDGQVKHTISRFDRYCTYRRMNYFLIDHLEDKEHEVVFRVLADPFDKASILTEKMGNPEDYRENNWYVGKILVDGELIRTAKAGQPICKYKTDPVGKVVSSEFKGIEAYTRSEVCRVFQEHLGKQVNPVQNDTVLGQKGQELIVAGTFENNPFIRHLVNIGFVVDIKKQQGYSIRCAPNPEDKNNWILAIVGADVQGALYGLRDLEHYYLKNFKVVDGKLLATSFEVTDYPRVENRGHWGWGVNVPDKKAWMENMSRWKLNELIEWDNYPPEKAKEYVEFAHSRGIKLIWGFGWGWNIDWNYEIPAGFDHGKGKDVQMCGSSEFNRAFFKREILKKVRELYVPSGCDGVYFQSFTEGPKCECDQCRQKTMGQVLVEFVNPIVAEIKSEFPNLWISCGVHANFGKYDELKDLDPRCNIYWENCNSATSIRGKNEDFGYINKDIPYEHGFSKTCPSDPSYTEESLQKWMDGNKKDYTLTGTPETYYGYMKKMQDWSRNLLGKESTSKHGSCVADHSVFCRRTPFMHVALAEALWNPDMDTKQRTDDIIDFLKIRSLINSEKTLVQHDALNKPIKLGTRYSEKHNGGGNQALVDGRVSDGEDGGDSCWQGYEGDDLDVVIDLGRIQSIHSVCSGYLQSANEGIYFPREVEYAISEDEKDFKVIGVVKCDTLPIYNVVKKQNFVVQRLDLDGRYIRIKASNIKVIPDSFNLKGRKAWLFVDEVMVNPLVIK